MYSTNENYSDSDSLLQSFDLFSPCFNISQPKEMVY